jgi:hypothetical protein
VYTILSSGLIFQSFGATFLLFFCGCHTDVSFDLHSGIVPHPWTKLHWSACWALATCMLDTFLSRYWSVADCWDICEKFAVRCELFIYVWLVFAVVLTVKMHFSGWYWGANCSHVWHVCTDVFHYSHLMYLHQGGGRLLMVSMFDRLMLSCSLSPYVWGVGVEGLVIHMFHRLKWVLTVHNVFDRLRNRKHSVQHLLWNGPSRSASRRLSRLRERQRLPKWYPL